MIQSAHRICLNQTLEQTSYFLRAAGIARFTWNWALAEYKRIKSLGQIVNWNEIKKVFRRKIDEEFPWVREVTKCAAEGAIADLRRSINTYYKTKSGNKKLRFPSPRKRSRKIGGFVLNNDQFSVAGNTIRVPRLGSVNMTESLRFDGKILGGRIKERNGRWYLTVSVEREKPAASAGTGSVGIDFGLGSFAVLSTGKVYKTQGHFRRSERKLRLLQRGLERKKNGSSRRAKWKQRIGRAHERIANQRNDFAHKFTTDVVRSFGIVCVEDLNLTGLCRTRLAKSFSDAAIGEAIRQLEYKSVCQSVVLQKVDRFFSSSKCCNVCRRINTELSLADRRWTCAGCGTVHDRDLNAARNIEMEGLRLLAGSGFIGVTPVEFAASTRSFDCAHVADSEAGTGRRAHLSAL